jgi:hypothetical protein
LKKGHETTCTNNLSDVKHFSIHVEIENICTRLLF